MSDTESDSECDATTVVESSSDEARTVVDRVASDRSDSSDESDESDCDARDGVLAVADSGSDMDNGSGGVEGAPRAADSDPVVAMLESLLNAMNILRRSTRVHVVDRTLVDLPSSVISPEPSAVMCAGDVC